MSYQLFGGEKIGRAPDFSSEEVASDCSCELVKPGSEFRDAKELVADRVVEMVKAGSSLEAASREVCQSVVAIKANNVARQALAHLRSKFELDNAEIKALVKAKALEKLLESEDDKVQLDAAKFLGQMPDIGLTSSYAKVAIAIGSFSDETKSVLTNLGDDLA